MWGYTPMGKNNNNNNSLTQKAEKRKKKTTEIGKKEKIPHAARKIEDPMCHD